MTEVELPDGTVLEFPEGMTRDQIKAAIDKRYQGAQRKVIATTKDGGRIVESADGTRSYLSNGYATNDPEKIERLMQGETTSRQLVQDDVDRQRLAEFPVSTRALEVVQGTPFVGEWADEAVGLIAPQAAENMRLASDAIERQRPIEAAALNIGGGLLAGGAMAVGAAGRAADWIGKGANVANRAMRAGIVAAPAGAVDGALSYAGRADDEDRLRAAGPGAAIGGAGGLIFGGGGMLAGEALAQGVRRWKKLDVRTIADEFGISSGAARMVRSALQNDDLIGAQSRLRSLGADAMLADAGDATGALLDAATQTGGRSLARTRAAVNARAAGTQKRLTDTLDAVLGAPVGVRTAARGISQSTAPMRQKAYQAAYARPIDYASPGGQGIEAVLQRVPPKTLDRAIREANEAMIEAGERNLQIMAKVADDGSVEFVQMPNVRQLDEIKKALGDIARQDVDQFGRPSGAGARAARLAGDLRDAAVQAVPEYGRALKLGGDKLQQDAGLDLGRKLLTRNVKLEDVREFVASQPSQEAYDALRQGLRSSIEDNMSNVRRAISDSNVDARESMAFVKDMSSRANIAKVRLVLGSNRAQKLSQELNRAAAALELRAAIAGNSKTAIRTSIQGQARAEAAPSVLRETIGEMGAPLDIARPITRKLAMIDPASISASEKRLLDEIADVLIDTQGTDARRALILVRRAMAGQRLKDEQSDLIGRATGAALAYGLYQPSQRSQAPR